MKVDIKDHNVLNNIEPHHIENYLVYNEWLLFKRSENEVSIWDKLDMDGNKHRVWVPLDTSFADFAESIARLMHSLSVYEERSQLQIIEDLETVIIGDVLRIKGEDYFKKADSTLPLYQGLSLMEQARDMIISGACSASQPRAIYTSRRSKQVDDYLKKVRVGQTERGSFVVKLISPLPALDKQMVLPNFPEDMPFERKAIGTLLNAVEILKDISSEAAHKGTFRFEPYKESVKHGVSANLCESIAKKDIDGNFTPVDISVTWSYSPYPIDENIVRSISIPAETLPHIDRAAKTFREQEPTEYRIEGYVTKLHREPQLGPGNITIVALVDDRQRQISIELNEKDYEDAIEAHKLGNKIVCDGTLVKEGKFFKLVQPINLQIIEE